MPEKKDALTRCYCNGCKARTMHVRFVSWHRDEYKFWKETLRCRGCGKERDRYALPIEQERLNENHPDADVVPEPKEYDALPLFAAMKE